MGHKDIGVSIFAADAVPCSRRAILREVGRESGALPISRAGLDNSYTIGGNALKGLNNFRPVQEFLSW
ncbi:MAG TPA: hypothetical protein PLK04_05230 [Bacillota bacterium]|nr:hypothetical protein [Bacillota bacterium]HPZ13620.1 hypothetical protein [Bacillota bacterium]HQD81269.1 hypothetical protein [Bacillota bacterium]